MYEKGARNFVMIGRLKLPEGKDRKNITPDNRYYSQVKFIEDMEKKGCRIKYASLDITDSKAVESLIDRLHKDEVLSIGGVVHIAGVIRDKMLIRMDQEDFDLVYDTKAKGAWLLSKYLWDDDLDFFLMYSSTGSVVTAVGQVNYAAGNSFLDSLAYYRVSCGKPALSLGWGPWGVGMVKDKGLIEHYKYQRGMNPIYAIGGMQALERLFGRNVCHAVIGEADWPLALKNYPGKPALFNHLAVESKADADEDDDINIFDKLRAIEGEEERKQELMHFIASIVAEAVHAKKEEIKLDQAINVIGIDSITATGLRNQINKACHINVSITDILSGIGITKLVEKHYDEIRKFIEDEEDEDDLESLLEKIENISEEEAEALLLKSN
jgi:hybrid polyketide synthase/nonribosomal peptide synthetase FtdB